MPIQLSEHFTLEEATFSSTAMRHGVDNIPSGDQIAAMKVAAVGMEVVRTILGNIPLHVDSWFRCGILNGLVGGSKTSAHMDGYAVDFICPRFGTPLEIVQTIVSSGLKFDQCIQEGNWVHISFAPAMRQRVLTAHFGSDGIATYSNGI